MNIEYAMTSTVLKNTESDWNQVREIILNAENFGPDFDSLWVYEDWIRQTLSQLA